MALIQRIILCNVNVVNIVSLHQDGNEDDWPVTVINLNYEPYKVSPENGQNENDEQNGL